MEHISENHLREAGFDIGNSSTHIVPIVVGSNEILYGLVKGYKGMYCSYCNSSPTVPVHSSRIRFAVTSEHTISPEFKMGY